MKKSLRDLSLNCSELPKKFSLYERNKMPKLSSSSSPLVNDRHSFSQEVPHDQPNLSMWNLDHAHPNQDKKRDRENEAWGGGYFLIAVLPSQPRV